MTLIDLKQKVDDLMKDQDLLGSTPITVCDLTDDSDENYHFLKIKGIDTVKVGDRLIIAIVYES